MKTKYIKKVLMCRPLHFSVDYTINPWMKPGSTDKLLANMQWETLVEILLNQGIDVHYIDQTHDLPDMVFSTDQGITKHNKVILSNFRYPQRRGETEHYRRWFETNEYETSVIPQEAFLEGTGDSLIMGDTLFLGYGFRSSLESAQVIASLFNMDVVPLQLIDPKFFHLDLALLPINNNTAIYYPEAFAESSQQVLQQRIPNLYVFTEEEVCNFAANSLVTDHHVIIHKDNPSFKNRLEDMGYYVIETDVGEFLKAGGGIHCLVQILKEEYE